MIKKLISVAFVAAVLSVGAYSYTQSQHEKSINELTLANVEALADGEINPLCPNGCVEGDDVCYCYGFHFPFREVKW